MVVPFAIVTSARTSLLTSQRGLSLAGRAGTIDGGGNVLAGRRAPSCAD
jgi:hypothetical protein